MKKFNSKNIALSVKDIDTVGRRVKIALSKYGNIDSDNDVIQRGAFAKSIAERGPGTESNRKIKFLRYHDFEHEIGKFISLEETSDHLIAIAELGRSTKGSDAFLDYQDGIITEHSIGFALVEGKTEILQDGTRLITEADLWEGSAVTFGANSETPVFEVSKGNAIDFLDKLNKKAETLTNALKSGGTDERLYNIEMNLRVCHTKYNELIETLSKIEPLDNTQDSKPSDASAFYRSLI